MGPAEPGVRSELSGSWRRAGRAYLLVRRLTQSLVCSDGKLTGSAASCFSLWGERAGMRRCPSASFESSARPSLKRRSTTPGLFCLLSTQLTNTYKVGPHIPFPAPPLSRTLQPTLPHPCLTPSPVPDGLLLLRHLLRNPQEAETGPARSAVLGSVHVSAQSPHKPSASSPS